MCPAVVHARDSLGCKGSRCWGWGNRVGSVGFSSEEGLMGGQVGKVGGSIGGIGEGDTMVGKVPSICCSGVLQTTFVFFTEEDKGMGWGAESRGLILPLVEGVAKHACFGELGGDFSY